jgi:hypothetical protein
LVATWLLCHVTNHGTNLFPSHKLSKKNWPEDYISSKKKKKVVKKFLGMNITISPFGGSPEKLLQAMPCHGDAATKAVAAASRST